MLKFLRIEKLHNLLNSEFQKIINYQKSLKLAFKKPSRVVVYSFLALFYHPLHT